MNMDMNNMGKKLCAFMLIVGMLTVIVITAASGIAGIASFTVWGADTAKTVTAVKSPITLLADGEKIVLEAYNINGNNYFKLRDIAYKLSGTKAQFEVTWDAAKSAVSLSKDKSYTAVGGEAAVSDDDSPQSAALSGSRIYLDGKEIKMTAYLINNNNFFKLRDIAEVFDFFVGWDDASKTISIETAKKYVPDAASVYNKLIALKADYPHGTEWTNDNHYAWNGGLFKGGTGCIAFAFILSDEAFGSLPARIFDDIKKVRVGDIVKIKNDTHAVVVLVIDDEGITVAEGNFNAVVHWGRKFTWEELKTIFTYGLTRYPE